MFSRFRTAAAVALSLLISCEGAPEPDVLGPVEVTTQAATAIPAIDFSRRPSYHPNNVLGLTFDDGPDATNTPLVLNTLQAKNVKATFFINTNNFDGPVESSPTLKAIIQRIVNEGHQLANHTVSHPHLTTLSASAIESQITGVQTVVNRSDVLGASFPKLTMLRAPYGEPFLNEGPGQAGYDKVAPIVGKYAVHMGWAIDTVDFSCTGGTAAQNKACVVQKFTSLVKTVGTGDYGMVLMHSVQPQTAAALPDIIDYAVSKGFVFKQGEYFVQARFGKSSKDIIYPPTACTQTPFGGSARPVPGTIQAEDFDNGGQACAYNDTTAGNNGNAYRTTESVDLQATIDAGGGFNVGWVAAGEWLEYTANVATTGNYKLELRVATTATGKNVDVLVDNALIADNLALPNTGAYQTFATVAVPSVALNAGARVVKVLFNTSSINLNWVRFTALAGCTPESNTAFCSRLGKNCGTVSGTDNCGAPRTVSSCGTCTAPATCSASNVCTAPGSTSFYFEAENGAGASTAPMIVVNDAAASGGKSIWSGTSGSNAAVPASGHVTFNFNVTTAGSYTVWGRFLVGPSTSSDDSLWVRIDTGPWVQWNDLYPRIGNAGYAWDKEHDTVAGNALVPHNLTTGNHVLEIAYRENGLKMDRFLVTSDPGIVPVP